MHKPTADSLRLLVKGPSVECYVWGVDPVAVAPVFVAAPVLVPALAAARRLLQEDLHANSLILWIHQFICFGILTGAYNFCVMSLQTQMYESVDA